MPSIDQCHITEAFGLVHTDLFTQTNTLEWLFSKHSPRSKGLGHFLVLTDGF
jgi:hypothetical protein